MAKLGILRRFIVSVVILFASFSSLGIVVYSGFQISAHDSSNTTINCSEDPYATHHPLQFTLTNSTTTVSCPWPGINSAVRISCSMIAFLLPFPLIYLGIVKKKKMIMLLTIVLAFLFSLMFLGILIYDSVVLNSSRSWCKDTYSDNCDYLTFIGMTTAEGILCVLWFFECVVVIYYSKKYLYEDYTNWEFDYGDHDGYATDDVPSNPYSARRYS